MKRTALKRKPWRRALGASEQWLKFRREVLNADFLYCVMVGQSLCEGPLQCAHTIPKQQLKRRGYGADVIYDPASAMTLCARHHNRHDRHLERVPDALIPERCREFAERITNERSTG